MRKTLRIAAWTAGAGVGLVVLGLLVAWLFLPMDKIKDLAVTEASARLGRAVTVEEVGLSVRGGLGVALTRVVVGNPAGFAGDPFLVADGVDLKLRIGPLLQKRVEADRLVVVRPRLHLARASDGSDNFTFAAGDSAAAASGAPDETTTTAPGPLAATFDRIEVVDARITYRDEADAAGLQLSGLRMESGLANPDPGRFRLEGTADWDTLLIDGPLPVLQGQLAFAVEFDQTTSRTTLERGDFQVNGLSGRLTGALETGSGPPRASGRLVADGLDPQEMLALVPADRRDDLEGVELAGRLDITADLDWDRDRTEPLAVSGRAQLADGRVAGPALPEPVDELTAAVDFDRTSVRVESCEIRLPSGRIGLQGAIAGLPTGPDAPAPHVDLAVEADLDLAFLSELLPPEHDPALTGRLAATARLRGSADDAPGLLHEARGTLTNLAYADARLPSPLEDLDADLAWQDDVLTITDARAKFRGSDLAGQATLRRLLPWALPPHLQGEEAAPVPELEFALHSRRLDVDRLFPAASPGAGAPAAPAAPTDTVGESRAMPDLVGGGTVSVDTLIYSRIEFTDITGQVTLEDRKIECHDLAGSVYTGSVTGVVTVDLADLDEPVYSGSYRASSIEADDFLTRFTRFAGFVFGKVDLEGTYAAAGRDPQRLKTTMGMDALAQMREGKVVTTGAVHAGLNELASRFGQSLAADQALRDLATAIRVADGRVIFENLRTRLGGLGDLEIGGSYGLAGDLDYTGALLLSESHTRQLTAAGGIGAEAARLLGGDQTGRLSLPLRVDGTFASPGFGLDDAALRRQAADSLTDQAKEKLKGLFD